MVQRNLWLMARVLIILASLVIGTGLLIYGITERNRVGYESLSQPEGVVILGDEDTLIEDMTIFVSEEYKVSNEEHWMGAIISFNSSCRKMNLYFGLPHEIDYVNFHNYTKLGFFYTDWSYNKTSDSSILFLSYDSSINQSNIRIDFDWRIHENISYDQERVAIAFSNPYFGRPLFQQVLSAYGLSWIPEIDRLTINAEGNYPVDLSLTQPQPSYYYYLEGKTKVYWTFDSRREVSSVQAVFRNPTLSKEKLNVIFFSGLFTAFGISFIFLGLKESLDLLRKLNREVQQVTSDKRDTV